MNLRIITKNHAADPEIEFLRIDFKGFGRAKAILTRWEVNEKLLFMSNYRLLFPLTAVGLTSVMYI